MVIRKNLLSSDDVDNLKKLGFNIRDVENNYHVFLPDKWYLYVVNRNKYFLCDEERRVRGRYLLKESRNGDETGTIELYTRYTIKYDRPYIYVFDNQLKKPLFSKIKINFFEKARVSKLLSGYLNRLYPDWLNPEAYWSWLYT